MTMIRRGGRARGLTVVELLISLAITLVVLAIVFQIARLIEATYRAEARTVELTSGALRGLEEMTAEIFRAGYGLGDGVPAALPCGVEAGAGADCILLRSNPEGIGGMLKEELTQSMLPVRMVGADLLREGDRVLLVEEGRASERAQVVASHLPGAVASYLPGARVLAFRSLDGPGGALRYTYSPVRGGRVMKLREVSFRLEPAFDQAARLIKEEDGAGRAIADYIAGLDFDYLDGQGAPLSPGGVLQGRAVAAVRIRLQLSDQGLINPAGRPSFNRNLVTAVDLDRHGTFVDFEHPVTLPRLTRILHPIIQPVGLASRRHAPWGVILTSAYEAPAGVFTFPLERRPLDAMVENIFWAYEVRQAVLVGFAPETGPLAGSLFLAARDLRDGQLFRIHPDRFGVISWESKVEPFDQSEALAGEGGMAFGPDGALYIANRKTGLFYQWGFDESGRPAPEASAVGRVVGSPGPMASGHDGSLYVLVDRVGETAQWDPAGEVTLWKLPFDERNAPAEPCLIASLPARSSLDLDLDPLGDSLYALVRDRFDELLVLRLTPGWMAHPTEPPEEVFRWSIFREDLREGRLPPGAKLEYPVDPAAQGEKKFAGARLDYPEELDFMAFDAAGSLYLGSSEDNMVLRFDFPRPGPGLRYAVGVAAVVEEGPGGLPRVRLNTWKKHLLTY